MIDFHTQPLAHQRAEIEAHGLDPARALFWEMGTGKTKCTIDRAALLVKQGRVDALLVLAPKGVHHNWAVNELSTHCPRSVWKDMSVFEWRTSKASTKAHQRGAEEVLKAKIPVVCMTYDAIMTDKGAVFAKKLLSTRKVYYVLDESHRIKTPGSARTKRVLASGKYAAVRDILSGTPVTNSPFDIYSQLLFLDPQVWKSIGIGSFFSFKTYFGIWEKRFNGEGREYNKLLSYKNLDTLAKIVAKYGSRLLKSDVLDLPPKIYEKRYFDISPAHRALYDQIRDEYFAFLGDKMVTAPLAITRLLRFQQIVSGYIPTDDDDSLVLIDGTVPRLQALLDCLEDVTGKVIIFARFVKDIDLICEKLGPLAVRYDGQVPDDQRNQAVKRFQNGDAMYFVANPAVAAEGLTLHAAPTVIYYNNSFKLDHRLQSEDRAHRIGQLKPVTYIDIVATGTLDVGVLEALRKKLDISEIVMGDEARSWI